MFLRTTTSRRQALLAAAALVLAALLPSGASAQAGEPLKVYVTPTPQGDILRYVQKLADADHSGLKLKVIESSQGLDANQLLLKGDVDANLFQHRPYFVSWIAAHPEGKGRLVPAATLLVNVFGLYSSKYKSVKDIPEGASILVPNEQTNLPRAFFILQNEGLLKLDHGQSDGSAAALAVDEKSIVANPKKFKFIGTETRLRAKSLPDVAATFINGDIALTHDIDPKSALALEDKAHNPYANILVVRDDKLKDPRVQRLIGYLTGPAVAKFIDDGYKGFVVPVQQRLVP
ncbi:MetQ/NlpA family ABC transporter substrate-binding protein [Xylophilus sp.]|uniref:MetQ/NlpA family ABC transporter substrate-binding protein n=1 Tax=Xylophilus sp. TaxID=2653893 RepID=UPI0013B692E9|nr:MetQ/NlpA family ABC transporter substrate-binding protein [Xylophilus sp.]KAF1046641.1 MAG: Methionine-binding lipoprotein MetQ [Xylophilus sp.]